MAGIKNDYCERTRVQPTAVLLSVRGGLSSFRLAELHPDKRRHHQQQARQSQDIPKLVSLVTSGQDFFPYISRGSKDVILYLTTHDNELPCWRHARAMLLRFRTGELFLSMFRNRSALWWFFCIVSL